MEINGIRCCLIFSWDVDLNLKVMWFQRHCASGPTASELIYILEEKFDDNIFETNRPVNLEIIEIFEKEMQMMQYSWMIYMHYSFQFKINLLDGFLKLMFYWEFTMLSSWWYILLLSMRTHFHKTSGFYISASSLFRHLAFWCKTYIWISFVIDWYIWYGKYYNRLNIKH